MYKTHLMSKASFEFTTKLTKCCHQRTFRNLGEIHKLTNRANFLKTQLMSKASFELTTKFIL